MTRTSENIGADRRHVAAYSLEELSKRQQRAAISNLHRAVYLRTDDPATHQRALTSLRQSIGRKVPGWQEMVIALSLLTGEDLLALMEKADRGKSRIFIDGLALTSEELALLRLWRETRYRRQCYVMAYLQEGQTEAGRSIDIEVESRELQAAERHRTPEPAAPSIRAFRVIDGGADGG